ncbi:hypothetical protein BpHYR1_023491 [Brachionus plicatilis]|uniref:Transmembrane protein n=1 Tax=Brachionus plicatilis TaxID=10195 RepID=A0A3M7SE08_BRAPC|nr:hypothetical protein BpHYR1_023491 [Brachionus plicatilis]
MISNYFKLIHIKGFGFGSKSFSVKLDIKDFFSFDQIHLECIDSRDLDYTIEFYPLKSLVIDSSLDLTLGEPQKRLSLFQNAIMIKFIDIKGFDLNSGLSEKLTSYIDLIFMCFFYTSFQPYSHGFKLNQCSNTNTDYKVFGNIFSLQFSFSTKYSKNTCPNILQNSNIFVIEFRGLSDSFLKQNILGFLEFDQTLNIVIEKIYLFSYRIDLNKDLLNSALFANASMISLTGSFNYLNLESIQNLKRLKLITFFDANFKFLVFNQSDWFNCLGTSQKPIGIYVNTLGDIVLSLDKFFTVEINQHPMVLDEADYQEFPNTNTFDHFQFKNSDSNVRKIFGFGSYVIYSLYLSNFLLNDVFLMALLVGFDLKMLFQLRKKLKKKIIASKMIVNKSTREIEKHQTKITFTVFFNIFVIISFKMVHFGFSLFIIIEKMLLPPNLNICLKQNRVCSNFQEAGELFYSISNIYTFVLFFNLNTNFKNSALEIFKGKKT